MLPCLATRTISAISAISFSLLQDIKGNMDTDPERVKRAQQSPQFVRPRRSLDVMFDKQIETSPGKRRDLAMEAREERFPALPSRQLYNRPEAGVGELI